MKIATKPFAKQILNKFFLANHEIYIVGGAVRDLMTNKQVSDWDFTTSATPEQILEIFSDGFYDNAYGTVGLLDPQDKLLHEQGELAKIPVYEITTFRKEYGYSNRRHPDKIEWGKTLEDDLHRRDFTINSMALKIKNPETITQNTQDEFELIDWFGGKEDIEKKLIRAVGDPQERFNEDALRMMRAVRFAAQLSFGVEQDTLDAIRKQARLIDQIAKERIRDELFKLLSTNYAADGIQVLAGSGLMEFILPELLEAEGVDQAGHHTEDVWRHSLLSLNHCPNRDPLVRFATLIHDIGKPYARKFICQKCQTRFKQTQNALVCPKCNWVNDYYQTVTFYNHEVIGGKIANKLADRFKLSNKQKDKLFKMVRWHMFSVDERQTEKAIRRFIRNVGTENLNDILDLRTGDRLGGGAKETSWRLERFKALLVEVQKQPFTVHDLKITGFEVMKELNLKPGPQVGEILTQLFNEVVDKKINNTESELINRLSDLQPA